MPAFKILKTYTTQYHTPIVLQVGDLVVLGEEEQDEKWKGWIWAECGADKGWIPIQILEIAPDAKQGRVLEYYSAQELDVNENDLVEKIKSLNGWTWCKNLRTKKEGWIPDEIIAENCV